MNSSSAVTKYELGKLRKEFIQKFDLFLCCSSFESRCLAIAQNIDVGNIGSAVIFYLSDHIDYAIRNRTSLEKTLKAKGVSVELKQSDPLFSADNMLRVLSDIDMTHSINSILFDITTFTHEAMLILLRLLHIVFPKASIVCAYTNAAEYNPTNSSDDKWLSKGIGEIRSVLSYPGNILPGRETHLIMIVGYEYERALSIINAVEPSSLALGFGSSDNATAEKKNMDANKHYLALVKRMVSMFGSIVQFEVKCDDPYKTYKELCRQVEAAKGKNILLVPLNNKLSTIGAAILAMEKKDVRLCYAPALVYNFRDYSSVGGSCYTVEIASSLK